MLLARPHRVDVDLGQGAAQGLRIVAAVEMLIGDVVERHLLGLHKNLRPHLVRLDAGFARDGVEQEFEREAHASPRDPAIRQDRTFVGGDRIGAAAKCGKVIWPGENTGHLRRLEARRERIGRIGSGIDRRLAVDPDQPAVAIGVSRDAVIVLAAVGAGGEMLAPILDPPYRVSAVHCQPAKAHLFRQEDPFVSEAAADIGRDDTHLPLLEAQATGKPGTDDVRHLAGRIERELFEPRVPQRDHAAAFDWRHALPRRSDLAGHLDRCIQCLADVDIHERLKEDIVGPMVMHKGRFRRARREHVVHGRQFFQIERDRAGDILGLRTGRRDAHREKLTDEAHLVGRERGLLGDLEAAQA